MAIHQFTAVVLLTAVLFSCGSVVFSATMRPAAIVHTAQPMSLEGNSDDWARLAASHEIVGDWGPAATFKLAFDDKNLYAWLHVRDASPLKNSTQVVEELIKGGDAIGFCIGKHENQPNNQRLVAAVVDGRPLVLAMRTVWPEKKKYTFRSVGEFTLDYVAPVVDAKANFEATADGYIARLQIPWKSLEIIPATGLEFPFDVQVIYSDNAGVLNVATAWWHCRAAGAFATTDLVTEARLYNRDWGIAKFFEFDPGPRPTRPLEDDDDQAAAFLEPGAPITFELDAPAHVSLIVRKKDGWIVRELLRARKLPAGKHTVFFDGRDRTGLPLPAGEYGYRLGIFDELKTTIRGSVGNSGRPAWRTRDGLGSIGGVHGGPAAVAASKHGLYMLCSGEEGQRCLRLIDPSTGKARWFASVGVFGTGFAVCEKGDFAYLLHRSGKKTRLTKLDAKTGAAKSIGEQAYLEIPLIKPAGMAIAGNVAFISDSEGHRLLPIDLTSGKILSAVPIAEPHGLCAVDDEHLLVCSRDEVVKIDIASGKGETFLNGLTSPAAVAIDADQSVFVVEQGDSQQIRKFDRHGKPLSSIGKPGGRAQAVLEYDPLAFRNIRGVAVDGAGHLWVAESESPRRFVKLTRQGRWLEDFYGPAGHVSTGADLDDLTTIYYQPSQFGPDFVEAKIDYDAFARSPAESFAAWKIVALHHLSQNGIDDTASPDLMSGIAKAGYGRVLVFRAENGERYLFKAQGAGFGLWIERKGRWQSAAALCEVKIPDQPAQFWLWTDTNGDSLVQEKEVDKTAAAITKWTWIDRDLTLRGGLFDWRPATINEHGVPIYTSGGQSSTFRADSPSLKRVLEQGNYGPWHSPPGKDGARYHASNVGAEGGKSFWDRASELRIARFINGELEWIVGHHNGRFRHNGDSLMVMNLTGEVDGVLLATEVGSNFLAYTTDGLALGWVSRDADDRPIEEGPTAWYVENVQPGLWVKDPKTGKRLLIGATTEDVRILEIDGVFGDDLRRVDGRVTISATAAKSAESPRHAEIPYATYLNTQGPRYLGVDGVDTEWNREQARIAIHDEQGLAAEVRLRRDAGMLYIFADVLAPQTSLTGASQDTGPVPPRLELLLGPAEPADRQTLAAGDTCLVFAAEKEGDAFDSRAFVYRPFSKPLEPSPDLRLLGKWGNWQNDSLPKPLDCSRQLTPLSIAEVYFRPRFDHLGWRIEACVPLALFPELTELREVSFERSGRKKGTDRRLDFKQSFRFNASIHRHDNGKWRRTPWQADKAAGMSALQFEPAKWGIANGQIQLTWPEIDGARQYRILRGENADIEHAEEIARCNEPEFLDSPPAGQSNYYWLEPVMVDNSNRRTGPVLPRSGSVEFSINK